MASEMSEPGVVLGEGRYARFVRREGWDFLERKGIDGIVAIVAVTDDRKLVLVEQYRPPVRARVIELPAGLAGDDPEVRGELLEQAAHRELLEETGYRAAKMVFLMDGTPSAGIVNESISFFRAEGLQKVAEGGGDDLEDIAVHEIPVDRIREWLRERRQTGALVDLKVLAGLAMVRL